jgi:hypothetical protein
MRRPRKISDFGRRATLQMGINKVKLCILFQIQSWYIYEKLLRRVGPKLTGAIQFENVFPGHGECRQNQEKEGDEHG